MFQCTRYNNYYNKKNFNLKLYYYVQCAQKKHENIEYSPQKKNNNN